MVAPRTASPAGTGRAGRGSAGLSAEAVPNATMSNTYDVFLSYRREGAAGTARLLQRCLQDNQVAVFLDVDERRLAERVQRLAHYKGWLASVRRKNGIFSICHQPGRLVTSH